MKREMIFNSLGDFTGWFDVETSTEISRQVNDPDGKASEKILLRTLRGNLIVNFWNCYGTDTYHTPLNNEEVAEILTAGNYDGNDADLLQILEEYKK